MLYRSMDDLETLHAVYFYIQVQGGGVCVCGGGTLDFR